MSSRWKYWRKCPRTNYYLKLITIPREKSPFSNWMIGYWMIGYLQIHLYFPPLNPLSSICNHTTHSSLIVYEFNCLTNYTYYKHNEDSSKTITVSRNNGWPSSKKMLLVLLYRSKSHFSPLSWRPLVIQSTMTKFESEETLNSCFW